MHLVEHVQQHQCLVFKKVVATRQWQLGPRARVGTGASWSPIQGRTTGHRVGATERPVRRSGRNESRPVVRDVGDADPNQCGAHRRPVSAQASHGAESSCVRGRVDPARQELTEWPPPE
jgi:hypothetical protein